MQILYSLEFAKRYKKLSLEVQKKAEEKETIFRNSPFDPRLDTHKLHGNLSDFWGFSVDQRYRIIFVFLEASSVKFCAIGDHSIYEKF